MKIRLENVGKEFKDQLVLKNINVEFEANQIYGIVGNNGSGKSVLLKLICGINKATEGTVYFNDLVLKKDIDFLPSLGVIEKPGFFNDLSAFENLKILASINNKIGKEEIEEVLKLVELENDNKPVGKYSLGMKQRLGIAQAIMEKPDVLILDEFSTGLDTEGVDLVHRIIKGYKTENRIIILTSHSQYDILTLCDTVYKITEGKIYEEKN